MTLLVRCFSDFRYPQRPVSIALDDGATFEVQVVSEWRIPEGWRFLVKNNMQQSFMLIYEEAADAWKIDVLIPEKRGLEIGGNCPDRISF